MSANSRMEDIMAQSILAQPRAEPAFKQRGGPGNAQPFPAAAGPEPAAAPAKQRRPLAPPVYIGNGWHWNRDECYEGRVK